MQFPTAYHCGEPMNVELQFHMRDFFNGTEDCPKEQGHGLFEGIRSAATPDPRMTAASKLL